MAVMAIFLHLAFIIFIKVCLVESSVEQLERRTDYYEPRPQSRSASLPSYQSIDDNTNGQTSKLVSALIASNWRSQVVETVFDTNSGQISYMKTVDNNGSVNETQFSNNKQEFNFKQKYHNNGEKKWKKQSKPNEYRRNDVMLKRQKLNSGTSFDRKIDYKEDPLSRYVRNRYKREADDSVEKNSDTNVVDKAVETLRNGVQDGLRKGVQAWNQIKNQIKQQVDNLSKALN